MSFVSLAPGVFASPQLDRAMFGEAASSGFRSIICNRPDGEAEGQPTAAEVASWAAVEGVQFAYVPIPSTGETGADVERMRDALAHLPRPVLAYCRSGARSTRLWKKAAALPTGTGARAYDIVVVGGGSAGLAAAASLLRREPSLNVAVIEPSSIHYYQPGWTLIGAGVFTPEQTRRSMADVMPRSATWIRQEVTRFYPETEQVEVADGSLIGYGVLIVAPGLSLRWDAIAGLPETLGKNGVTSNYQYDLAPYTHELVTSTTRGTALFTQPPMPIKCAGAPQKAVYLACDHWRRSAVLEDINVEFHTSAATLFGVAHYVPALMREVERYGIELALQSRLVAVDGASRTAVFERSDGVSTSRIERRFDMLHVVPPQVAPRFVASSPLADDTGFIAVDPTTLRHPRYANVYGLGDACSAPNAKTVAAARKQAPVVAVNALATLKGTQPTAAYDGYGACPLTVARGRIVLAEFGYGGKLMPSLPKWLLNGDKPTRAAWMLKKHLLPHLYWNAMLRGREWLAAPRPHQGT